MEANDLGADTNYAHVVVGEVRNKKQEPNIHDKGVTSLVAIFHVPMWIILVQLPCKWQVQSFGYALQGLVCQSRCYLSCCEKHEHKQH